MTLKDIKKNLTGIKNFTEKLGKGDFKLLFFVADSKGVPNGSLTYTYDLAYNLKKLGYNVEMLYAEKDYVGVEGWLGKEYAELPHFNTATDNVDVSPCDFLFIPELFSNVMSKVKDVPCKKIAILENFDYMTDLIPFSSSWESLGIHDCITSSQSMADRLHEVFPRIKTYVVRPLISDAFKKQDKPNLIINIVGKNESIINSIVKPFKWKFPHYDFVTFRFLHGRSHEELAKYLPEGCITVWVDDTTDFGYTALEAMACGNIVIGKIPENEPEWMVGEDGNLKENGVWFYKMRDAHRLIANTIQTILHDKIPSGLYDNMAETVSYYSVENHIADAKNIIEECIEMRKKEFDLMKEAFENKEKEIKKEEK